jgi:hypothetical protein
MFAYNSLSHSATTFAPLELIHGRSARTSLTTTDDQLMPALYRNQGTPQSNFLKQLKKNLDIAFEVVWKHKKHFANNDYQENEFKQGDTVIFIQLQAFQKKSTKKSFYD